MTRIISTVLIVWLAMSTCGVSLGDAPSDRRGSKPLSADYGWLTDYRAALTAAKETGKPIMVVFRCVP